MLEDISYKSYESRVTGNNININTELCKQLMHCFCMEITVFIILANFHSTWVEMMEDTVSPYQIDG